MNRLAVTKWPDDTGSATAVCHKADCGRVFHTVAVKDGVRCGRDKCPHCGELRRVPDEMHPVYLQWFGVVGTYTRKAVAAGVPEDVAETVVHTAYIEALFRWVPGRASLSTLIHARLNGAVRAELNRRGARPMVFRVADCRLQVTKYEREDNDELDTASLNFGRTPAALDDNGQDLVDAADQLLPLLAGLPARERRVIAARFGVGCERKTLTEIGAELGVTKERARQIEKRAMRRMRESQQQGGE
jgi:RNA polymerase sigma factor (sigma-70 family)